MLKELEAVFKRYIRRPDYAQVSLPFFDVLEYVHRHSLTKWSGRIFLIVNLLLVLWLGWWLYRLNFAATSIAAALLVWFGVNILVVLLIQGLDLLLLTQMRRQAVEECTGYVLAQPYCDDQAQLTEIRGHAQEMRNAAGITVALPSAIVSGLSVVIAVVALQQGLGSTGVLGLVVAGLCAAVGYVEHLERTNACTVLLWLSTLQRGGRLIRYGPLQKFLLQRAGATGRKYMVDKKKPMEHQNDAPMAFV